ncbi:septation protein SepH [Kineococcus sp. SYSU DK004]|uniref:septation protein SepH n=1 Tax=Kineococcus sp. SYSU DK004 TaxID=3383125 RepID=UPI003D7D5722
MQDLRLVGVHDDGEHVVLGAADGTRYRLRVDEALRAAVRRDRARLGQLQIQMDTRLRPRDIQARIRAGETAEDVAAAGGLPVEHVRRYEGPVLAERAHVAGLARRSPCGRGARAGTLDEVVVSRLTARAVDPEGARWDAWRSEEGAWTVQVEFVAGGRSRVGRWTFDPASRVLSATDDEARWLSEEEPPEPGPLPARRLASVGEALRPGERVYDVEADGGVRASGRARSAEDLLDALDARRGVRPGGHAPDAGEQRGTTAPEAQPDPADGAAPRVDALLADPPPAHPADSAPHEHPDDRVLPDRRPARGPAGRDAPNAVPGAPGAHEAPEVPEAPGALEEPAAAPADGPLPATGGETAPATDAEPAPAPDAEPAPQTGDRPAEAASEAGSDRAGGGDGAEAPRPGPRRRNRSARRAGGSGAQKRSSVPSWDEIMFGTKKD